MLPSTSRNLTFGNFKPVALLTSTNNTAHTQTELPQIYMNTL
jgi:hypothetical protein